MRDASSRRVSLATKRRTSKPRESFVFQTEPSTEVRRLVLEGDGKVMSTEQRGRKAKFSNG